MFPTFALPLVLLALPIVPWLLRRWQRRPWPVVAWPNAALFRQLPRGRSRFVQFWRLFFRAAALVCVLIAIAGPRWPDPGTRLTVEGIAIEFVLDVSGSMAEPDLEGQRRIDVAKTAIQQFISEENHRSHDLMGLVLFATHPETACPLTLEHESLLASLRDAEPHGIPTESETNIGDALAWSLSRVQAAGKDRRRVIVLVTDGEHNVAGPALTPLAAARLAAAAGVTIYTINAGQDPAAGHDLETATSMTGGQAFRADNISGLTKAFESIDAKEQAPAASFRYLRFREAFSSFAIAAAIFLAAILLLESTIWRIQPVASSMTEQVLNWLAVLLVSVAAFGPRWGDPEPIELMPGRDVVLVLDMSRSMGAADVLPNRFSRSQLLADEMLHDLTNHGGHRVGVVAFASRPTVIVPLTRDYDHIRLMLKELDINHPPATVRPDGRTTSGTRIGAALELALLQLPADRRLVQDIVLFSDGDDPAHDNEWRHGSDVLAEARIPAHVITIGDVRSESAIPTEGGTLLFEAKPVTTRPDELLLRELARRTGGRFVQQGMNPKEAAQWLQSSILSGQRGDMPLSEYQRPAGKQNLFLAAALFCMVVPMIGWQKRWALAPAAILTIAAADPGDYHLHRGIAAFDADRLQIALDQFSKAAERTTDPGLLAFNLGVTLARLGRDREAELNFRRCLTDAEGPRRSRALFNLGTVLMHRSAGRSAKMLREAVHVLEQAAADQADEQLSKDVDWNLTLAQQLLAEAPAESQPDNDPPEGDGPLDRRPMDSSDEMPPGQRKASDKGEPRETTKSKGEGLSKETDQRRPPGRGSLPPINGQDTGPLDPGDAAALLIRETDRIAAARKAAPGRSLPSIVVFPDW